MNCEQQWRIIADEYGYPEIEHIQGPYTEYVLTFLAHARKKLAKSLVTVGTPDYRPQDVAYFQRMEAYFLVELESLDIKDPAKQSEGHIREREEQPETALAA